MTKVLLIDPPFPERPWDINWLTQFPPKGLLYIAAYLRQAAVDVHVLDGYRLRLRFEDGVDGVVDIARLITFSGVFAPLREHDYFAQVRVNPDIGTICWPNDADLDPDVLYSVVSGQPIPTFADSTLVHA